MMRKLYRSKSNNKIAGICGGLGNYFKIDPSLIRLILILVCFFTAILPVLIAYFIAVIIIPLEPIKNQTTEYRRLYRSKKNKLFAGVCGGIAEFFKVDPVIIRLIFVFLTVVTAIIPMLISYVIAWVIIPENPISVIEIEIEKDE